MKTDYNSLTDGDVIPICQTKLVLSENELDKAPVLVLSLHADSSVLLVDDMGLVFDEGESIFLSVTNARLLRDMLTRYLESIHGKQNGSVDCY